MVTGTVALPDNYFDGHPLDRTFPWVRPTLKGSVVRDCCTKSATFAIHRNLQTLWNFGSFRSLQKSAKASDVL